MKKYRKKMLKIISIFIMSLTYINTVNADSNFKVAPSSDLYSRCNETNKCIPICVYSANPSADDDTTKNNGEVAYIGYYYSGNREWEIGFVTNYGADGGWLLEYSKSTILPATDIYWSNLNSVENDESRKWSEAPEYNSLKDNFICPKFFTNDINGKRELCLSNSENTCKEQNDFFGRLSGTKFNDDRSLKSSFASEVGDVINDTYNNLYILSSQYPAGADPDADKKLKFLADIDSEFSKKYNPNSGNRDTAKSYCSVLKENLKDEDKYFKSLASKVTDYRTTINNQLQESATRLNVRNKEVYTDESLSSLLTLTDSSGNKKYRQIKDLTGQTYIEKLHSIYAQNVKTSLNYIKETCNSVPGNDIQYDEAKLINTLTTSYETTVYKNVKLDTETQFSCGTLGELADLVKTGYFIIEMVALVILVVFTVLDYAKVILSGEQDQMKKTNKRLATRLIVMVVILLLPALINFVLGVFNIEGFNSENPLCVEIKNK